MGIFSGEYGLEEAIDELKTSKRQIKVRDKQIEELTHMNNELMYAKGQLTEENGELRSKMGLEVRGQADGEEDVTSKNDRRPPPYKALMQVSFRSLGDCCTRSYPWIHRRSCKGISRDWKRSAYS